MRAIEIQLDDLNILYGLMRNTRRLSSGLESLA